ncbi:MAG: response regulator transcription factor [Clostridiales bacterium]|jgi:DNA-binding response OmpR family regulator|nr:response regulator transcription factor [Clostridiales bacterium]MBR6960987.1 response regulator transcription factor [Clostridiales bacterium]
MKILIAEDTKDLNHALTVLLQHEGYDVDSALDGQQALDLVSANGYDAVILDIMMPKMDGITVLTTMRQKHNMTPAMLLTAKADIDDRVAGLDAGADDYLPKPFAMKELLARVRALVRRGGNDNSRDEITYAGLVLNGEDLSLSSENTVRLSLKEYELMREFMRNPGRELATDFLIWKIWNNESDADADTVWLYVSYLKNKLNSIVTEVTITGDRGGAFTLSA